MLLRCVVVAVVVVSVAAGCGGSADRSATAGGCSSERARATVVARTVGTLVHDYRVPGAVAAVCTPRGTTLAATGRSDVRAKTTLRPTDRFAIASVTKTFVATVVLQLVGEGRLHLRDSVERWLPGVVPLGRRITIRELLNHTSGISDYFADEQVQARLSAHPRRVIPPRALVARAVSHPLRFEPGREFDYSNTNYLLLGLIVERATGSPLAHEVSTRILEPLALTHTTFPRRNGAPPAVDVRGYAVTPGGFPQPIGGETFGGLWAAAGMVSTVEDVARFFGALLGGTLLRDDELRALKTVRSHYGLGIGLFTPRASSGATCTRAWGNVGEVPGHATAVLASGHGDRVVVVATNGTSPPADRAVIQAAADLFCA